MVSRAWLRQCALVESLDEPTQRAWAEAVAAADAGRVLAIAEARARAGHVASAYELASHVSVASDVALARKRAGWAMRLERYADAIAASEVALTALLQPGLSLERFLELAARGAPIEGLLRVERAAVLRLGHLHEPIAVRWEALQRSGRRREANLMRVLCLRYFSERASVWASAGNQALDEDDLDNAERYFARCLQLDGAWTAALAGRAIVLERRKDWPAALAYRARVVQVERAHERSDVPNLQRLLRYALALGRVGRWREAEPWLRRCVDHGAYSSLPSERPVLLRVFSSVLYAPAIIAQLSAAAPLVADPADKPALLLAAHEAQVLASVCASLEPLGAHELRGMCAWLAGDHARAYALFDEAECEGASDMAIQYLLLSSALAIAADDVQSIRAFAERAAREILERASSVDQETLLYAWATCAELGLSAGSQALAFGDAERELAACEPIADLRTHLRALVACRVVRCASGESPLTAAVASARALAALPQCQFVP